MCLSSAGFSCLLCMTSLLCSTYCAGAEEPCKHAFRLCAPLTRHLHPQSCLPARALWEKGPARCPQSRGKQKDLGPSRSGQLCRKMTIVAKVTVCKQISPQHGQFCAGMSVTRPSLASGAHPSTSQDQETGASLLCAPRALHRAMDNLAALPPPPPFSLPGYTSIFPYV